VAAAGGANQSTRALGDSLGSSTEAIRAGERDGGAITKEDAMTGISDLIQTWPDAMVDIGLIELTDHYWGIGGSIPYDGHVVLAVIGGDPTRSGSPPVTMHPRNPEPIPSGPSLSSLSTFPP
jgi:hypothetical protein